MILERLFTVGLLSQFNLVETKRTDRGGNKRGLKGSAAFELIVEVAASSYKKTFRREIVNFIQRKLKNAPDQIKGLREQQRQETEEKAEETEEKEESENNVEFGDKSADDS
ncbi:uncharacterized protein LOC105849636 [Hydra vulgaris]|uniref:uncharacterized protein LOC105849636 n=1 Tax=Hydra vulgaris TaxID=6087 RepID=UPI0032EA08A1